MSIKHEVRTSNLSRVNAAKSETVVASNTAGTFTASEVVDSQSRRVAQSFIPSASGYLKSCEFSANLVNNPLGVGFYELRTNSAGVPGTLIARSRGVVIQHLVQSANTSVTDEFTQPAFVTAGTVYWLVYNPSGMSRITATNRMDFRKEAPGDFGGASEYYAYSSDNGATWTTETANDLYFSVSIINSGNSSYFDYGNGKNNDIRGSFKGTTTNNALAVLGNNNTITLDLTNTNSTRTINFRASQTIFNGAFTAFNQVIVQGNGGIFSVNAAAGNATLTFGSVAGPCIAVGSISGSGGGGFTINAVGSMFVGRAAVPASGALSLGTDCCYLFGLHNGAIGNLAGFGSMIRGYTQTSASGMRATGQASFCSGAAFNTGDLRASGSGSHVFAVAEGSGAANIVEASQTGAMVQGSFSAGAAATSVASGNGSAIIAARSLGTGAPSFTASSSGSLVGGYISSGGTITSSGNGSHARGSVSTGNITASGDGSFAGGFSSGTPTGIHASNTASFAFGTASATNGIVASGSGSFALGSQSSTGSITATNQGSFALGYTANNQILSSGLGSLAGGQASLRSIEATATSTIAWGNGVHATGEMAVTFGYGNDNSSYSCLAIGRFSLGLGFTTTSWESTDPVFIIGGGTSDVSRANIFRIDKDGKLTTTASQVHKTRTISSNTTLSARTDRTIFVDTSSSSIAITFPPGEEGLEFFIKDVGNNAGTNNILFAASGFDSVEGGGDITTNQGARHFVYESATGIWRRMSEIAV